MYGILFLFIQVLVQDAISFPCGDYVVAYIPIEELIGPVNWNTITTSGPECPTLIEDDDSSVSLAPAPKLTFAGPVKARGKITILGGFGGLRPFYSPFWNPFFVYPQIYLRTLPTVCLPLPPIRAFQNSNSNTEPDVPIENPSTVTPENIEPTVDFDSVLPIEDVSEVTSNDSNEEFIDSDDVSSEALATVTPAATLESSEIIIDTVQPPLRGKPIPTINFDPIPDVPIVDFDNLIPNIAKHIEKPLAQLEAKIQELVAKIALDDVLSEAPIEIETHSSDIDDNDGLPIAGSVSFNGLVPASGGFTILGNF